jgi:hypothetical protein
VIVLPVDTVRRQLSRKAGRPNAVALYGRCLVAGWEVDVFLGR